MTARPFLIFQALEKPALKSSNAWTKPARRLALVSDPSDFKIQNSTFLRLSSFRFIFIMLKAEF